jgi:hypothetical protein
LDHSKKSGKTGNLLAMFRLDVASMTPLSDGRNAYANQPSCLTPSEALLRCKFGKKIAKAKARLLVHLEAENIA